MPADLTPAHLAAIREAAEKATPGPWYTADWNDDFGAETTTVETRTPETLLPGQASLWPNGIAKAKVADTREGDNSIADATHIANCDPSFIIALLDAYEARGKALEAAHKFINDSIAITNEQAVQQALGDEDWFQCNGGILLDKIDAALNGGQNV